MRSSNLLLRKLFLLFSLFLCLTLSAHAYEETVSMPIQVFSGHSGALYSVAFSPNGQYALSGSSDKTLKLWNIATGELIRTFTGHTNSIKSVAFSPDGQTALSGSTDDTIKLWNISTGELIHTFSSAGNNYSIVFSPNGQTALSGGSYGMKLWNIATGELIRTFASGSTASVAYSPSGQTALSASGSTIKLWNLSTGQLVRTLTGHTSTVRSVTYSSDGSKALSASTDIKEWNLSTGAVIRTFSAHTSEVYSAFYSPDEQTMLSASYDRSIKLWDLSTGTVIRTISAGDYVYSAVYSPDGQRALSGVSGYSGSKVKLWDLFSTTPTDVDTDNMTNDIDNCPITPNSNQLDTDYDAIGDACDTLTDSDGDGIPDDIDDCHNGIDNSCSVVLDTDGDGVVDIMDNCDTMSNPNQTDTDNDGLGDVCDPINNNITTSTPTTRLINISTRAKILGGADNPIAGFIIQGTEPLSIVVTARGKGINMPQELLCQNTSMTVLQMVNGSWQEIGNNDNWQEDAQAGNIPSHLQPSDPSDAALLLNLNAGVYTAIMGCNSGTGVGLIGVNTVN